ncbi:MAG TPA: hypothetical protein VFK90_07455 [Anaeromyxobacter sp.]|nr:hypothetical protein [Anaeromyxobacter sp.]
MRLASLAVAAAVAATTLAPRAASARPAESPARAGSWSLEVVDESGAVLPTFFHRGRAYVLGTLGRRYALRIRNGSPRRVEVVVSVDGRDVVDGKPASFSKPGYVVNAFSEVVIDGYRLSEAAVAAFRFGTVARSYASRMGDARDVGVIGVAVFPEREVLRRPPPYVPPYYPRPDASGPSASADRAPSAGSRAEAAPEAAQPPGASAPAPAPAPEALAQKRRGPERPGLGTEFGEERESRVVEVAFERARPQPDTVLAVRYDDREGLLALGIDVDRAYGWNQDSYLRDGATPFRGSAFAQPPPGWGR